MSAPKNISGGVCAARGFRAAALRAGIKRVASARDDLALVVSETPCVAAGVFTTNRVQAAPVRICKEHLLGARHRAVLLNSGNANACTGARGLRDARACAELTGQVLGVPAGAVLVCSTGRIGVPLPMEKIGPAIATLPDLLSRRGNTAAATAIMTSDTFPKEAAVKLLVGGTEIRIGGMAKGAGMINPDMATMLCVITTDARLRRDYARRVLARVVERTFNRISVDGDMSTNDTVLLLAGGLSGAGPGTANSGAGAAFERGLEQVCASLALQIVGDGEGTTKVIELEICGAKTAAQARLAADAVANSVLLKCAWAGGDPNWGRILDALGYSGAEFDPDQVDVFYDGLHLVAGGCEGPAPAAEVRAVAARPNFRVTVNLHAGRAARTVYTSDLTEEYVRLNLSE